MKVRKKTTTAKTAPPERLGLELTTFQMVTLIDYVQRSAQLAYTRLSGLSDFQWRVIVRVNELEPLSMNDLAALMQRDLAQVSRAVKGMVAGGLLHRGPRGDGRGVWITATLSGKRVYGPLKRLARARNGLITEGLTVNQLQVLKECIAVMTRNAQAVLGHEESLERSVVPSRGVARAVRSRRAR